MFSRAFENSVFQQESPQRQCKFLKSSYKTRDSRSVQPKDFMIDNKKNLKSVMNKLHPLYDVWDEDIEKKDLGELLLESKNAANKANESTADKAKKNASRLGSNDGSVTDEKNALIEEMNKRIEGQSLLSA